MPPRPYRMGARAQGVAATRARIVQAAVVLHGEQGIGATTWEEIAGRAGVSTATVYRHFPSFESLIPACARDAFEAGAQLPSREVIDALFAALPSVPERIRKLVEESCTCYQRGEAWLAACRREALGTVPGLVEIVASQQRALDALIRGALAGTSPPTDAVRTLGVLLDFPFWKALIGGGVPRQRAPEVITRLAVNLLQDSEGGPDGSGR